MSNKVWILAPQENWILDRFTQEWYADNSDISVTNIDDADVLWLFADWCSERVPRQLLYEKKVIVTVHHIVPEKFDARARYDFDARDRYVNAYHVPNERTKQFIQTLTKKPIVVIPYWANQKIWKTTDTKEELRKKYKLPADKFLIGSFQRDTEGKDLISPKLEKGPDILADTIIKLRDKHDIEVVLGGWRRQYIIKRLDEHSIKYHYFENPKQAVINDLYQTLDLYPVTARYEGGPQSLIECGLLNVPVISTPVGMSELVLSTSAIGNNLEELIPEIPNIGMLKLPQGYQPYRNLIESL